MNLGRYGIWTSALDVQPAVSAQGLAREIEDLGFGSLWFPEAQRREALTNSGLLLAATRRIVVGTGIASIYARDAMTTAAGWKTLTEAYPERFVLGLGVSHVPSVESLRGHRYGPPVATMSAYLEAMSKAPYLGAPPTTELRCVLAALGPRMLRLAGERSWGAHPYFVPTSHTREARQILGDKALLVPEQAVVLESDPGRAREIARSHTRFYLGLENYAKNLLRHGFTAEDLAGGGSDRLVDALVAWGDLEVIRERLEQHLDAGADHVLIQVIAADPARAPLDAWRSLAAHLL
ncbi:MAG TPA: LLM class F420-dependent oxidoreductase [Candidatus Nitrosotalea sp.]|nr:LLM class F420-dependent oxidoreductase [Candidatus Nitrosotalea sp.]